MKIQALALITALVLPTLAIADNKTPGANTSDKTADKPTKLSEGDVTIISHVHHVNQLEIDVGKAALKSGTESVKSYGNMLVSDHQSADKDLAALAKKHGLTTIPAEKPQTDEAKQEQKDTTKQVAHLKTLKGAEFDREFLAMMVTDHDKEVARIETSIGTASDPDLRTLLTSIKPVLQRHADEARNLQKNPQTSATQPTNPPTNR
ncbi:MAG TPA: DUF4142 domain-containing protein [Kofleriaceae bacterium]|jgi:putative membrane protein|nr:DUF4142 domain-containing protein [Kofleriaceae bacterium]